MAYEKSFQVSWAMLDGNNHMANTAFLDVCVDTRFSYFSSRGFTIAKFHEHGIGPVVRRDEVDYHRELRLLEPFTVRLLLAGASPDCSRFRLRNEIRREGGELAARITSLGGWLDLKARKLVVPPRELAEAVLALDHAEDYAELESSVRSSA